MERSREIANSKGQSGKGAHRDYRRPVQVYDHKVLEAIVTFDDGFQPLPAFQKGSAEGYVVHGGLRRVKMIGSSAQQIVNNHP